MQRRWPRGRLHRWSPGKPEFKGASCCWRQQLRGAVAARFASLTLEVPPDAAPLTGLPISPGVIEVEFATGTRLRICGPVDTPIVSAVMQALADCGRR